MQRASSGRWWRRRATPPASPGRREELDVRQPVRVRGLGELLLGGVPVTEHQQCLDQIRDRKRQVVPGTGPAQVPGGGARGLRRGCGVGNRQRVRQVEQRASQAEVSPASSASRAAFAEVGHRFGRRSAVPRYIPRVRNRPPSWRLPTPRAWPRVSASVDSWSASGEPANTSSARELLQGVHRVGVGICPQHLHRGGELITRLSVTAPLRRARPAVAWARAAARGRPRSRW